VPGSCPCLPHASKQCRMEGERGGITVLWFKTCSQKKEKLFKIGKKIKRNKNIKREEERKKGSLSAKKSFILRMVFFENRDWKFCTFCTYFLCFRAASETCL
jgi:hypothetical protein